MLQRQCHLKFTINADFEDEVLVDVVPLGIHGIVMANPYLFDKVWN